MIMWEHTTVPMNTVAQVCFGSDEKQQFEPKLLSCKHLLYEMNSTIVSVCPRSLPTESSNYAHNVVCVMHAHTNPFQPCI